jgi:outer membrane lipoprotein carrier protein LolA
MIFGGSQPGRRARKALWLLSVAVCPAMVVAAEPGGPPTWDIERLMRELAQVKSAKATFVERKHLRILATPLRSSGTLLYVAPSRLEKHTLSPRAESLILERDGLTIETESRNQRRTLDLQEHPLLRAFVESIRSTLAGDLATLTRYYEVGLEGSEDRWRLRLRPIEPGMRDVVSEIRVGGEHSWIDSVEIIETTGDHSSMTITRDGP